MRALLSSRCAGQILLAAALTMLTACDGDDAPDDVVQHPRGEEIARIGPPDEALANAEIAKLDPAPLNDAEIRNALGMGPRCEFRYTSSGKPVLALGEPPDAPQLRAVVKLNGYLVYLEPSPSELPADAANRLRLASGPIRMTLLPGLAQGGEPGGVVPRRDADLVLEVGQDLRVGYGGYLSCAPASNLPRARG